MKISFVLPTLNEEFGVCKVIDEIISQNLKNKGYDSEIIIVDGESTDKTVSVARNKGSIVKVINSKRGYGRQYKVGFKAAEGDIIITGDSDGTYPFTDSEKLIELLLSKNLDFLNTNRFHSLGDKSMTFTHYLGNKMLTFLTNILFGVKILDSQSGMWVFKRKILNTLDLTGNDMDFSQEIKIEAFTKLKCMEVPIRYSERIGEAKLSTVKHGLKNSICLFRKRFQIKKK